MLPNRDDYRDRLDRLQAVNAAEGNRERDDAALSVLEPGMGARGGGVTGFIEEVRPEKGQVTVVDHERSATVPARSVEPTNPKQKDRFDRAIGAHEHDISDLEARYGLEDL